MAGDLWCQEPYCTADNLPYIFDYGETVGDMHIAKCVAVMRTAAIYAATRQGDESIWVKIAHEGFEERLKREATLLEKLQREEIFHPALPTLLPAHIQATVEAFPYGRSVFQRRPLTYAVFEPEDGDILRAMLLKNQQPWYQHAAWIILSLTDALALIHSQGGLHLSLSPESVLVRLDKEGIPRPTLLDLGAVTEPQEIATHWSRHHLPAPYIAPELLSYPRRPSRQTDVYGLGLLLYEMLAGRPAFHFHHTAEADLLRAMQTTPIEPLNRPDLKPEVAALVQRAIAHTPSNRFTDMSTLGEKLMAEFRQAPPEKKKREINWQLSGMIALTLFFILLLFSTAFFLAGP